MTREQLEKVMTNETMKSVEPVIPVTHVNNLMYSIFSTEEVYINNQQIYNSNGLYAFKSLHFPTTSVGAISEYEGVLHCEAYDFEDDPEDVLKGPMHVPFIRRRVTTISKHEGFTLIWQTWYRSSLLLRSSCTQT